VVSRQKEDGESHRGECFPEIRFRRSPSRFATKISKHLRWDVTGSFTCVVISVEKLYFWEILAAIRSAGVRPAEPFHLDFHFGACPTPLPLSPSLSLFLPLSLVSLSPSLTSPLRCPCSPSSRVQRFRSLTASEPRVNNLKDGEDLYLKAKARIWP